jgi:cadmium resistance protein CadD (predicted permease)
MFSTIIISTIIYWASATDSLILLALLYVLFDKKPFIYYLGQIIASIGLVMVSLFCAVILKLVPEEEILGLIPWG